MRFDGVGRIKWIGIFLCLSSVVQADDASFWGYPSNSSSYYSYGGYGSRRQHRGSDLISLDLDPQALRNSSFRMAARENRFGDLELLLKQGAEIDSQSDRGDTALIYAARNCSTKVVSFLLDNDADPNIRNQEGYTALILASRGTCTPVVKRLLRVQGIHTRTRDRSGKSALDYAKENEVFEVEGPSQDIIQLLERKQRPGAPKQKAVSGFVAPRPANPT